MILSKLKLYNKTQNLWILRLYVLHICKISSRHRLFISITSTLSCSFSISASIAIYGSLDLGTDSSAGEGGVNVILGPQVVAKGSI